MPASLLVMTRKRDDEEPEEGPNVLDADTAGLDAGIGEWDSASGASFFQATSLDHYADDFYFAEAP